MDTTNRRSLWIWVAAVRSGENEEKLNASTPVLRLEDGTIEKYAIGESFGLLVSEDNKSYQIGQHFDEYLTLQSIESSLHEVTLLKSIIITEVCCGHRHSAALTQAGIVYCWGVSSHGQCGIISDFVEEPKPVGARTLQGPVIFRSIACGKSHTMAISRCGELWGWGMSHMVGGKNSLTQNIPLTKPELVNHLIGRQVLQVSCGAYHTVALTEEMPNKPSMQSGSSTVCDICKQDISKYRMLENADHVIISDSHVCSSPTVNETTPRKKYQTHTRSSSLPFFTKPGSLSRREASSEIHGSVISLNIPLVKSMSSRSLDIRPNPEKVELTPITPVQETSDRISNGEVLSLSTTDGGSSSSLISMENAKCRMTLPLTAAPDDLGLKDPESALAYLKQLSPDENTVGVTSTSGVQKKVEASNVLAKSEELEEVERKTFSERITNSLTENQLLSPLTSYSKNVFTGVMDRIEWIKSSTIEGVTPIKDFLLKDKRAERGDKEVSYDDPLRWTNLVSQSSVDDNSNLSLTLRTEVWAWGNNDCGQLGMSDFLDRFQPTCIKSLTHRGIVKVVCGSNHSLALSSNSEVFSWGENDHGQLGRNDVNSSHPMKIECDHCIWDVAAGQHHSLFLIDGLTEEPSILSCGTGTELLGRETEPHPLNDGQTQEYWRLHPIHFSSKMGFQCCVAAGPSALSTCLTEENPTDVRLLLRALAKSERNFYRQVTLIKTDFLRPLKFSDLYRHLEGTKYAGVLSQLLEHFGRLSYHIGLNTVNLNQSVISGKDCDESTFSYMTHNLLQSYERYFKCLNDILAFGFFEYCEESSAKQSKFLTKINIAQLFKKLLGQRRVSSSSSENFLQLLQIPAFRLREYSAMLKSFSEITEESISLSSFLENLSGKWNDLWTGINNHLLSSNNTRRLWKNCFTSSKLKQIADNLKKYGRYIILHSKQVPLDNLNAGRFSSNWFLLFNDNLILIANGNILSYDLKTLWCSTTTEGAPENYNINIVTPEEEFTVSARQNDFKTQWFTSLNRAINSLIRKDGPISPSHESKQYHRLPPIIRHACYTYTKTTDWKGATYDGAWLNGKPHGKGKITWENGATYSGQLKDGKENGYGEWEAGSNDVNKLRYHGCWKDGKVDGHGKLWYSKTQVYEGAFKFGLREGHGILRTGSVTEGAVYVGAWKNDQRDGFGVEDNITKGQKYLGMWSRNEQQGPGILVTLDGLYCMGCFSHGNLTGDALLVEGLYVFEGLVTHGLSLNGKGRLTMPSGDKLEGSFSGCWDSNIRISGHFHRNELVQFVARTPESPQASLEPGWGTGYPHKDPVKSVLRRYNKHIMRKLNTSGSTVSPTTIHPDMKWTNVFATCRKALKCPDKDQGLDATDTKNIWDALSASISAARRLQEHQIRSRLPSTKKDDDKLNWLDRIPSVVTENRAAPTASDIENIKEYVAQAFDTAVHPLGELAESLSTVFRDSYSGAGAHKLLLPQAVGDVRSFTRRTYDILRCLFPMLNNQDNASHMKVVHEENTEEMFDLVVTAGDLLLPALLPRVYPSLFTLYALHHEREDKSYWERVTRLNRHPDIALLSFLGVKPKFWLLDESEVPPLESPPDNGELYDTVDHAESSRWKHLLIAAAKDCSFLSAIETLQLISTTFVPAEKLNVIQSTFKRINETVLHHHKQSHSWSMDDLFPVFQYVVVRARISHLGCEIQLIEDFLEPDLCKGEKGIMFTTLKACYFQIRVEKNM